MDVSNRHVRNVVVWGEHGETSHADARHAQIQHLGHWNSLTTTLHDDCWLRHDLVKVKYAIQILWQRFTELAHFINT